MDTVLLRSLFMRYIWSMVYADYETLNDWLSSWNRRLKEPKDLLLGRLFVNIVRASLEELEERYLHSNNKKVERSKRSWERRLLGLLEAVFTHTPHTVDLYKLQYGSEVEKLEQLLSGRGPYDIEQIYPILRKIEEPPSPPLLKDQLQRELLRGSEADQDRLRSINTLLARRGLQSHDDKKLKELPKKVFAREYVSILLEEQIPAMVEDHELTNDTTAFCQQHLEKLLSPESLAEAVDEHATDLFGVFRNSLSWWILSYRLIDDLRKAWTSELLNKVGNDTEDLLVELKVDEEATRKLGEVAVRRYARAFLRCALRLVSRKDDGNELAEAQKLGDRLGDLLINNGVFRGIHSWHDEVYPRSVKNRAAAALTNASIEFVAEAGADMFLAHANDSTAAQIAGRVTELLRDETKEDGEGRYISGDDVEDLCLTCFARLSTHEELGRLVTPLTKQLLGWLPLFAEELDAKDLAGDGGMFAFWERWKERFSDDFKIFDYLPWDLLKEENFERVISAFVAELDRPQAEWNVVFRIPGIDPQEVTWSMGDALFYDPRVFDYGEGRWLGPNERVPENTSLAQVTVSADTDISAEEAGRRILTDALNALSFALSSGKSMGGYKPIVDPRTYVSRVGSERWKSGASRKRAEMHVTQHAKAGGLPELGVQYDHLLSLAARNPRMLRDVQAGFLRSMHWYVKGRWEPDPVERFLHCWVGLEHLFVEGRGQSKVQFIDNVPRLSISWGSLEYLWWVMNSLRGLVDSVVKDAELNTVADSRPELEGWSTDVRVLLDPKKVKILAVLASEIGSPLATRLEKHTEDLRELALDAKEIDEDVQELRDGERFKLLILSNLRNRLVHEAITFEPNMETLADELEEVLNRVLVKMAATAIDAEPEFATVEELMEEYQQQPWASALPGRPATEESIGRLREVKLKIMRGRCFKDDSTDLMRRTGHEYSGGP